MRSTLAAALPLTLMIAACGEPAADPPAPAASPSTPATNVAAPHPADRRPIDLGALTPADIAEARLSGELGCSFRRGFIGETLWMGMGDVLPEASAVSIVKIDEQVLRLTMEGSGGYDAMADGARFTSGDVAVELEVTGDEPIQEDPPAAMESGAYPATMTLVRGGQTLAVEGVLECGP